MGQLVPASGILRLRVATGRDLSTAQRFQWVNIILGISRVASGSSGSLPLSDDKKNNKNKWMLG